ncbi:hypothetical protein KP79_PYT15093 [Mizuhopecten yessoensis]|uniref:Mutator-like transposase domain-containing protein n=1 Tax=Mizuhopecten yessoensis TaxID=6573 RepID=A0A210Q6Y2_MIZYE|nr:hypothetical protein KP79_PYT15093 [Mizuhopecten yessoensis]
MGKNIGDQLTSQGILVKYATTDGDGTGAKGIEEAMQALYPMWSVERLADPTHLCTLNVSLPKYQNFGRNAEGRLDSTILTINNTAGKATQQKVQHLGGTLSNYKEVRHQLDQISSEEIYQR